MWKILTNANSKQIVHWFLLYNLHILPACLKFFYIKFKKYLFKIKGRS